MRINRLFLLASLVACVSNATSSSGQESQKQSCDVPLVVTRFVPASRTIELVKDLGLEDLTVQLGALPGQLESASIEDGPKRVAQVLDASESIPADEWKLQKEMTAKLISHARISDRFAIVFVGIDRPVPELLSADEVVEELRKMSSSRPTATEHGERIYDAIIAAANHLNPPKFGDAIFLFGHAEDSGSKAGLNEVLELLLKNRFRFYAISFTNPLIGKLPPGFNLNKPLPANVAKPKLVDVSAATGYFVSFRSVEDLSMPGQTELFEGFLADLYAGIAEPYRLKIPMPDIQGEVKLNIVLTKLKERKINERDVHYPHFIYPCPVLSPASP